MAAGNETHPFAQRQIILTGTRVAIDFGVNSFEIMGSKVCMSFTLHAVDRT